MPQRTRGITGALNPAGTALLVAAGALAASALAAQAQTPSAPAGLLEWGKQPARTRGVDGPSLGALPSEPAAFRSTPRVRVAVTRDAQRPAKLVLDDYLPPIANQGQQGSCVGWSTGYYFYTYMVSKQMKLDPSRLKESRYQFSPAFIYNQGNEGKNEGMPIEKGFRLLYEKGCARLAEVPYDEKDFTRQPEAQAAEKAKDFKARAVCYLYEGGPRKKDSAANVDALKTYLAETHQPFVTGIPIFKDFPMGRVEPDFIYNLKIEPKKENFYGFHAITIVGYDDEKKAFRMVNSWGPNWGDRGFMWLDQDFVRNLAIDGFTVVPGGPVARGDVINWTQHVTVELPKDRNLPGGESRR